MDQSVPLLLDSLLRQILPGEVAERGADALSLEKVVDALEIVFERGKRERRGTLSRRGQDLRWRGSGPRGAGRALAGNQEGVVGVDAPLPQGDLLDLLEGEEQGPYDRIALIEVPGDLSEGLLDNGPPHRPLLEHLKALLDEGHDFIGSDRFGGVGANHLPNRLSGDPLLVKDR